MFTLKTLDLFFFGDVFYGFGIHGTHHHVAPPSGRINLELFRSIKQAHPRKGLSSNHPFSWALTLPVSFKGREKKRDHHQDDYIFQGSVNPSLDVLLEYLHPRKLTWNLKMMVFHTPLLGVHFQVPC